MSVMVPPTDAERPHIERGPRGVRLGSNYAMVLDAASRLPALIWTNMMLALETQGMWSDKSASTESTERQNVDISFTFHRKRTLHTCDNERRSKGSIRKAEIYRKTSNGSVARVARVAVIDE